jgi:hypothetical protein
VKIEYEWLNQKIEHEIAMHKSSDTVADLNFAKLFYLFSESDRDVRVYFKKLNMTFAVSGHKGQSKLFKVFEFAMRENTGIW